jgi:hypothetical protein
MTARQKNGPNSDRVLPDHKLLEVVQHLVALLPVLLQTRAHHTDIAELRLVFLVVVDELLEEAVDPADVGCLRELPLGLLRLAGLLVEFLVRILSENRKKVKWGGGEEMEEVSTRTNNLFQLREIFAVELPRFDHFVQVDQPVVEIRQRPDGCPALHRDQPAALRREQSYVNGRAHVDHAR